MAILAECPLCHLKQKTSNKRCKCGENLDTAKRSQRVRYWIAVRDQKGRQVKKAVGSFPDLNPFSIKDAKEANGLVVSQKREGRALFNLAPGGNVTFSDLIKWYQDLDDLKKLKSFDRIGFILANFEAVHGGLLVNDLNLGDLTAYQKKRAADGAAPRTIDYEVSVVKTMVTKAFYHQKIDGKPLLAFKLVRPKLEPGSNARKRTLKIAEYLALIREASRHLEPIIVTAFHTGMRMNELLGLKWSYVDLEAAMIKLPREAVKTEASARRIPINHHVGLLLSGLPRAHHKDYVFTYLGRPIGSKGILGSFRTACSKAKVPYGRKTENGFTFHDIRRTVKTNMLASGMRKTYRDLIVGHALTGMDIHYIVPSDEQLTEAMAVYTKRIDAEIELINVAYSVA